MKTVLVAFLLIFGALAHAEQYIKCSYSDGTTAIVSGYQCPEIVSSHRGFQFPPIQQVDTHIGERATDRYLQIRQQARENQYRERELQVLERR